MGLHICYELRLPCNIADNTVLQLLEKLREYALTQGASRVTPLMRLDGSELRLPHDTWEPWSLPRFFHIACSSSGEGRDGKIGQIHEPDRLAAVAFYMYPGEGSEAAAFGFVRPFLTAPLTSAERAEESTNWFWHYCCKTQYASQVSDEHLVRCHLALVHVLEEAERLGIAITVRDETHYWETRSTDRLIGEVRNMNRIVARIAGAFHDAAPEADPRSPVFEDPDFERLETEPLDPRHAPDNG
jgi:hypothetical protein